MSALYQFGLTLVCKAVPNMERCVEKFLADNAQCIKGNPYYTPAFPKLLLKRIFGDGKINMNDYLLDQSKNCLLRIEGPSKLVELEKYDGELMQFGIYLAAAIATGTIIYFMQKLIRKYRALGRAT